MNALRLLIADDHMLIRRGVRDLLATRPGLEIVGEACSGAEAVELATSLQPDIAILDYSMPQMNGPQAARLIRKASPATGVIVLTMHESEMVMQDVLQSGARGLVLKSDADRVLLNAVETVAANGTFFTQHVVESAIDAWPTGTARQPARDPFEPSLTEREREVLGLLADGLSNKQVAERLHISVRTAESHRININRKLGFQSVADLVRYVLRTTAI
ncbi:response regulator [Granulicella sp. 5B5]|nr:response regulator [Granulicella sp. 5B5]